VQFRPADLKPLSSGKPKVLSFDLVGVPDGAKKDPHLHALVKAVAGDSEALVGATLNNWKRREGFQAGWQLVFKDRKSLRKFQNNLEYYRLFEFDFDGELKKGFLEEGLPEPKQRNRAGTVFVLFCLACSRRS